MVVCSNYSVSSMSRPSDSEIEIEFIMILETFGVITSENVLKKVSWVGGGGGM